MTTYSKTKYEQALLWIKSAPVNVRREVLVTPETFQIKLREKKVKQ